MNKLFFTNGNPTTANILPFRPFNMCTLITMVFISGSLVLCASEMKVKDSKELLDGIEQVNRHRANESLTEDQRAIALATIGWIDGFRDCALVWSFRDREHTPFHFPEKGTVTTEQFMLIIKKYLNDHPEELHNPALVIAIKALTVAFPPETETKRPSE